MKPIFNFRKLGSYINFSILPALLLVFIMVGTSLIFKSDEIILPELSALSIGCFVYRIPAWTSKPIILFLVPSGTALIGFLINQINLPIYIKLIMVIVAMVLFLKIIGIALAPSLATGLLPVITNCQSLYFMASILVFTILLFLIVKYFYKNKGVSETEENSPFTFRFLLILIAWILICRIFGFPAMYAIPPVVVVGFEYIQIKTYNISITMKHIVALTFSALVGTLAVMYLDNLLLATIADFVLISLFLKFLNVKLPPAYAMGILAMVLGEHLNLYFPIYVAVMSTVLFTSIILLKKRALFKQSKS